MEYERTRRIAIAIGIGLIALLAWGVAVSANDSGGVIGSPVATYDPPVIAPDGSPEPVAVENDATPVAIDGLPGTGAGVLQQRMPEFMVWLFVVGVGSVGILACYGITGYIRERWQL